MSVSRFILGVSVPNIIRERYCFTLVCTFNKAFKNIKLMVDVQKGAIRVGNNIDNRCATLNMIFSVI